MNKSTYRQRPYLVQLLLELGLAIVAVIVVLGFLGVALASKTSEITSIVEMVNPDWVDPVTSALSVAQGVSRLPEIVKDAVRKPADPAVARIDRPDPNTISVPTATPEEEAVRARVEKATMEKLVNRTPPRKRTSAKAVGPQPLH
jgi:hypothetical protein